jgi:cysteine synthase A
MSHSSVYSDLCQAIGNTPLIHLKGFSKALGVDVFGKAEFLNPGGSVKDRTALGIVLDAERRGLLSPGGTIVEGTAGNTGIGLTLVAHARGYRSIIVIPNNQSTEKIELLRALGAEVRTVPPAPFSEPGNYNKIAARIAEETPGAYWANQFDNRANAEVHFQTTGPEIWEQTGGKIASFAAAIGTGGTLNGTARYLKSRNSDIHVLCPDPYGAAMWSWFRHGHTDFDDGDSIAEGIGQGRVTENVKGTPVDSTVRVHDRILVEILYYLLREEGLFLGTSSGVNVAGAIRAALVTKRGPSVTILCDGAQRYLSRLFNLDWLQQQQLTPEGWSVSRIIDAVAELE